MADSFISCSTCCHASTLCVFLLCRWYHRACATKVTARDKNPDATNIKSEMVYSCRRFYVIQLFGWESIGESLSSLSASSLENVSAISSLHSLAKTVLNFSLALLGLISSEHLRLPPLVSVRWKQAKRTPKQPFWRCCTVTHRGQAHFYTMTTYIIYEKGQNVK